MSQNTSFTIQDFLSMDYDTFHGRLSTKHSDEHSSLAATQSSVWKIEFEDLQRILKGKKGRILFEYRIPGLPKVVDVILLIEGKIFVLEYKGYSTSYNDQDIRQTNGYALRLKFFHSRSNDNWIIPILIATDAPCRELVYELSEEDMVYSTILCNSSNLGTAIEHVLTVIPYCGDGEWEQQWEFGVFKASPTIIAAARNVWRQNNVSGFNMGEASAETRLSAEGYIINTVVEETRNRPKGRNKSICFVTGVPGAGKTLVGLNISVALQHLGASMLSGNGPLVEVLTTALKRDLTKNKNNLVRPREEISVESIIRGAYGYKKEIFEKRLEYGKGVGTVELKHDAELGSQHVIIFDEAQRAWNKAKMIRPGQSGRKPWQEEAFPFSEPGLLLWDMNQRDWGVFVCLVGGGQEINTGEAGICEWLRSIKTNPDFDGWHIYLADELRGEEYDSKEEDGLTLDYYREYFKQKGRLTVNSSLHLTACQRSNRSDKVASFVQELLECNKDRAKEIYAQFKNKFQIYLTRNVETAKIKLRERKKQLENRGFVDGKEDEEVRIGVLMSSKAARLRPLGFEIKKVSEYLSKVPNWFLDPPEYVGSSDFLEIALNEFFVQGLELDITAVIWDADFRYNKEQKTWDYYDFNGRNWSAVEREDTGHVIKRFYMKNAYRVLLTRARAGMIIVVPEGSDRDKDGNLMDSSRNPEFYDATYQYLKEMGLDEI